MHPSPSILSTQALLLCRLPGLVVRRALEQPDGRDTSSLRRSASAQMRRATTNSLLSFVHLTVQIIEKLFVFAAPFEGM